MEEYRKVYLGVASFVHVLKILKNQKKISDFCRTGAYIVVWVKNGGKEFHINAENREPDNCGYIPTHEEVIVKLFKDDFFTVIDVCKKDYDKGDSTTSHCPVSRNSAKRGNIREYISGYIFNCRLKP